MNHDIGQDATAVRVERRRLESEQRRATLEARPNCIYLLYDRDDTLLYVGISVNGPARLKGHSVSKDWWQDVATVRLRHVTDRTEAEALELELIRTLYPRWNVAGVLT